MTEAARTFLVTGSDSSWSINAPGFTAGPLANQQIALEIALALAARENASVTWSDDYTGRHTVSPAPNGWFSDSLRVLRAAPPVSALLSLSDRFPL